MSWHDVLGHMYSFLESKLKDLHDQLQSETDLYKDTFREATTDPNVQHQVIFRNYNVPSAIGLYDL